MRPLLSTAHARRPGLHRPRQPRRLAAGALDVRALAAPIIRRMPAPPCRRLLLITLCAPVSPRAMASAMSAHRPWTMCCWTARKVAVSQWAGRSCSSTSDLAAPPASGKCRRSSPRTKSSRRGFDTLAVAMRLRPAGPRGALCRDGPQAARLASPSTTPASWPTASARCGDDADHFLDQQARRDRQALCGRTGLSGPAS